MSSLIQIQIFTSVKSTNHIMIIIFSETPHWIIFWPWIVKRWNIRKTLQVRSFSLKIIIDRLFSICFLKKSIVFQTIISFQAYKTTHLALRQSSELRKSPKATHRVLCAKVVLAWSCVCTLSLVYLKNVYLAYKLLFRAKIKMKVGQINKITLAGNAALTIQVHKSLTTKFITFGIPHNKLHKYLSL